MSLRTVRCKFKLVEIKERYEYPGQRTLIFEARYDSSIPEDRRFCQATPTATLTMSVNGPALNLFELGVDYYFDASAVVTDEPTA